MKLSDLYKYYDPVTKLVKNDLNKAKSFLVNNPTPVKFVQNQSPNIKQTINNISNSPRMNVVDKVAKNQFVQGMANAGADLTNLSTKFAKFSSPINYGLSKTRLGVNFNKTPQVAVNARQYTESNKPTTFKGKALRFAGENVPAMIIPASKGITAERIASPAVRLLANSGLRGAENAVVNTALKVGRDEKITPKGIVGDVATGAAFNAALSPFELLGRPGVQGAIGEMKQNWKGMRSQQAVDDYHNGFAKLIAKTGNVKSVVERLDEYEPTKLLENGVKRKIANDLVGDSNPNRVSEYLTKFRQERPDIKVNKYYDPGTKPGFARLPQNPDNLENNVSKESERMSRLRGKVDEGILISRKNYADLMRYEEGITKRSAISPDINLDNLNISKTAKGRIEKTINQVKPQIESKVGARLTNQEAVDLASRTSKTLTNAVGRDQTLQWEAATLKARQQLAKSAKSNKLDKDFIENLKVVKSLATDTARKLQSFSISADPLETTPKQAMVEAILKVEKNTNKILKAAEGVDFNNAKQATDFYRSFIKPNASDWIDLLRYNSMLSSPLTHIKNITTNALQVGAVKPIEKTLSGVVDIFSKNRTNFAGEGLAYAGGTLKSTGKAIQKFADVMTGKQGFTNQDLKYIPPSTGAGTKVLSFPTKMLEGMDQFFTTLATGGEQAALNLKKAKGVKIGNMKSAEDRAAYTVFRDKLGSNEQGYLLDSLDWVTGQVERARNAENPIVKQVAKFTLPFVKTPMNIFKQGLEYSPAGFFTTVGAKNVTEQVSKALIGSAVFGGAATLIGSGRLTWGEPINEKQRNEFRAAGMQPYAVKIGDKWVAYKYLGPLAFPLAMTAAIDYEMKQGRLDDTTSERILGAVARYGEFLADQSYAKSMGDLLKAVGGSESGIAQMVSNYPQQMIPFRALGGWLARITDPYQRKISKDSSFIEKQTQLLMQNIPGLSQRLETRPDTFGNPIPNQNRVINAFSPLSITTENPLGKDVYNSSEAKRAENRQITDLKKGSGGQTTTGKTVKKIGDEWKTFDTPEEADVEEAKSSMKKKGDYKIIGDKIVYYNSKTGKGDSKPYADFQEEVYNAQYELDKQTYKNNDDYSSYRELQKKRYQYLQDNIDNADQFVDQADIIKWTNSQADILKEISKMDSQGGITEGGKAKKAKISTLGSEKVSAPKFSLGRRSFKRVKPKVTKRSTNAFA